MHSIIDRDILISEYLQFCNNFSEIESSVLLPKTLHNSLISCNDQNDEECLIDYDHDIDMDDDKDDDKERIEQNKTNMASTLQIFKIFSIANLANVFPNLYYVLKLSVTLPVTSCCVERRFSKLKLIKTKLRTSMIQDQLENLIKISCERDIQPNIENIIISMAGKSSVLTKCLIY